MGSGASGDAYSQGTVVFEITFDTIYTLYRMMSWSYEFDEPKPNANNFRTVTIDYGVGDFLGGTLSDVEFTAPVKNLASIAD